MTPRITINTNKDGELEIWLNPAGRDLLVRELQNLNTGSDHFHFGPEEFDGEVPVQHTAYRDGDRIIEWGKVLFRPDDWDAVHFPHVLNADEGNGS
jgi:hypothetical protein